ncbi:MAG: PAS domain S-box protein [Ignavibacteriales bacterium]|nr:PAS domain S-box protein [Ignavibacteriales bacterium]
MTVPLSRYGRVFDLLPEMIFVIHGAKIVDHNPAASDGTGYPSDQLNGMSAENLAAESFREELSGLIASQTQERKCEMVFIKADGTPYDADITIRTLTSKEGTFRILVVNDITELKKKELDLLRFSNVIHHTINPIQITDATGVMVYVNPAFERTSGYKSAELIGRNPNILSSGKHSKEFWRKVWTEILAGRMWVGEVENRRKDGSLFQAELVISPIIDPQGAVVGFMGAHRDITHQKELERQLVRSQKMESIGTLAAGIAHEVGNPLTSISSLVQVILRTTQDEFAKEKLELIKNQINRITRIIRDLVDFSRPSSYVVKPTEINEVLRDALNIVQYGKKVKHIRFDVHLNPAIPRLHIVPDQLVQVFINILMNAVDALDGIPGTIRLTTEHTPQFVRVVVADTGRGIDPGEVEKIFEPFYSTKEVGKGTGLGLWVSYGIVKNFGGDITVESSPGKGSTFIVTLPYKGE